MSARERLDRRLQRQRRERAHDNWEHGCNMFAVLYSAQFLFLAIGCALFGW